jgi:serine/threonine-protein kinase RsbW
MDTFWPTDIFPTREITPSPHHAERHVTDPRLRGPELTPGSRPASSRAVGFQVGIFRIPQRYQWVETDMKSTVPFTLELDMETESRILDSTIASIEASELAVLELARRSGFIGPFLDRIGLAVREIATNAVVHGNRYDSRKKIFVLISRTRLRLEIVISDQGQGFDLNSVADPLDPDALLRPSGRGLYLARTFMDELHVHRGDLCGTTVVLVKYLNGVEA